MKKSCLFLGSVLLTCTSFSQNGDIGYKGNLSIAESNYESFCIRKNDTILYFRAYPTKEKADTIVSSGFATKLTKSKWITNKNSDGCYAIIKYKTLKKKQRKDKNNFPNNDCKCIPKGITKQFYPDGSIVKTYHFGKIIYNKKVIPKKKQ
jgi:hypothetical protein